jgi:multiple sugar transport system ATP-binding protein
MAEVHLDRVGKVYANGFQAVADVSLNVADGELVVLVGPSGCGKSTLLRMIAGLESISSGRLSIGGQVVNDLPPKDRDIAMVFQNYALYPHMTVAGNLAFSLRLRGLSQDDIARRVAEAAALLELDGLLDRRPAQLSGGQRQRVALGRALVRHPAAFLLDEPLSNLDAKLRASTRVEIARLQRRLRATMIYVTHDQVEAMTLGQRIVVLDGGRVQQIGTPTEIYRQPASIFVAGFFGSPAMNFVSARLAAPALLILGDAPLDLPAGFLDRHVGLAGAAGQALIVGVRAEDLRLLPVADGLLPGTVEFVEVVGSEAYVTLKTGSGEFNVRTPAEGCPAVGSGGSLAVDVEQLHFFSATTQLHL